MAIDYQMMRTSKVAKIAATYTLSPCVARRPAAQGRFVFRQYEYEEDIYLSLDGSATVYVNTSVAALDALRGRIIRHKSVRAINRADVVRSLHVAGHRA